MSLLHIVVLALVQGITEFLPISSSGHLVLVPWITGWQDQGLQLDIAVHVGTLGAVIVYFWRDVAAMLGGAGSLVRGRYDAEARLLSRVAIATVPIVIAGLALKLVVPEGIRSIEVIGWTTLVFGLLLYAADRSASDTRTVSDITVVQAIVIGFAQCLALIPGTSRSGITMTAARALGIGRTDAARFSLLLSIPTITAAGLLLGLDLAEQGNAALTTEAGLAAALAFVSALVAIAAMMAWLRRATFTPFVIYRVILGLVLLALAYGVIG